ncbi:M24 family metallopeptidase [Mesorhizobium japonicum]|uniref:Mll6252 protein n=1 Tax=Mesorhizobium japonicum (strain LMG 29417 / CECT 9101 / MAFF 303099) TaxID=266835 RepID=Q989W8_RHILO|nr:Xaa-Pro peptidase family protein [Mesorhizobium japonicum]BAB52576.1 mll6252 [Mesorhizobium japonicum MAFF 303099]
MDFVAEEYSRRLAEIQRQLELNDLPAILLHQPENIRYVSGFHTMGYFTYHALLVPARGNPILVIRDQEENAAKKTAWVKEWTTYSDAKEPLPPQIAAAVRAIDQAGLAGGKIGVDYHSWFLTPERLEELRRQAPHTTFIKEPKIVDHLRLVKSAPEIEVVRRAAQAAMSAMQSAVDAVETGVSERKLAAAVYSGLVFGGGEVGVDCVITSGERTFELHGSHTDRRVQAGDQVYFELTGSVDWYLARCMRAVINGTPTDAQRRVAESIILVQDAGIARMKVGAVAGDVDRFMRHGLLATGARESYTNRTAYSLGLNNKPSAGEFERELVPGAEWTFEAGMVFHVLMMAQGIGFSETVLITDNGPERLTTMERKLFARK